jgi:hypothetical protein
LRFILFGLSGTGKSSDDDDDLEEDDDEYLSLLEYSYNALNLDGFSANFL